MKLLLSVASASAVLVPCASQAHVKWFCAYNTAVPPLPLEDVITPVFLIVAAAFGAMMILSYSVDSLVDQTRWAERIEHIFARLEPIILPLVRVTVGVFFISLWVTGGLILTPELKTSSTWVPWLQVAIGASVLLRPALIFAALGIVGLYAYGVWDYGAFHMMDYPIFLGLAAYLGCSAFDHPLMARIRLPALYFNVALSLMWGAVEKFGYPYWTFPLLAAHRSITLGMRFDWFMTIAGFVEFSLAFFMLTSTAMLRLSCAALLMLMISAIPEFGKIDAIGHSVFIAGLVAMFIGGNNAIELPAWVRSSGAATRSSLMTLAYGSTIAALFGLYYESQYLAGR